MSKPPKLWVVAGPNGAGKSSLVRKYLANRYPVVNPDDIGLVLRGKYADSAATMLQAGRQALKARETYIAASQSFVVETTMTGRSELTLIKKAKYAGFRIHLGFVGLQTVSLSAARVAERVRSGGHGVPVPDIVRRYDRSLGNLPAALNLADRAWVFDNSGEWARLLLSRHEGRARHIARDLPLWVVKAIPETLWQSSISLC